MRWSKKEKNILALAYFVRYGYIALMFALIFIMGLLQLRTVAKYFFCIAIILDGVYYLVGRKLKFKHLYCAMQNAYHQEMTPHNSGNYPSRMERDIFLIGILFIGLGTLGILALLFL